jgi:trimeric autotransporter adhesin
VWVVGNAGKVLHYDGMTWKAVDLTLAKVDLLSVHVQAANQILVTGANGSVYTYDGANWKTKTTGVTNTLRTIVDAGEGGLVFAGDHGATVRFVGEQRTVFSVGSSATYLDLFKVGDSVLVVGDEALRIDATGYHDVTSDTTRALFDGFGLSPTFAWAVGTNGTIVKWDGTKLASVESGSKSILRGVWASSEGSAWVVGAGGLVLGLFNGVTWTQTTIPGVNKDLHDVWGTAANDTWVVGDAGTLLHWNGSAWTVVPSGAPDASLRSLWGTGADDVWAVGTLGTILHWNGSAWTVAQKGAGYSLNGVWGRSKTDVYAVGSAGTILHWDGTSWSPQKAPADVTLFAIGAGTDGKLRAAGEDGVILYER